MPVANLPAPELDHSNILVTFVHGTWGRGVFPALRISKRPFWFEPGSAFRDGLLSDLQSRGTIFSFGHLEKYRLMRVMVGMRGRGMDRFVRCGPLIEAA